MRIAIVKETVDPQLGGAEISLHQMAYELVNNGSTVDVLCRMVGDMSVATSIESAQYRYVTMPNELETESKSLGGRRFVEWVDQYVSAHRRDYDIVLAITPCLGADVYQPRGGTYPETIRRSVAMVRNPLARAIRRFGKAFNPRQSFYASVERRLLTRANPPAVAAVSEYVKTQIERDFPGAAARTRVVFNGVSFPTVDDAEREAVRAKVRTGMELPTGLPMLISIGNNSRLKGLNELFKACNQLRERGTAFAELRIANGQAMRAMPGGAGGTREKSITFLFGYSLQELLFASDLLIHPTWYDPCSRVVLEALCCGTPVVTTRWNGAAEAVRPGPYGVVIDDPGNTEELTGAILEVLQNEQYRRNVEADRTKLADRLSMRRHAAELLEFFKSLG